MQGPVCSKSTAWQKCVFSRLSRRHAHREGVSFYPTRTRDAAFQRRDTVHEEPRRLELPSILSRVLYASMCESCIHLEKSLAALCLLNSRRRRRVFDQWPGFDPVPHDGDVPGALTRHSLVRPQGSDERAARELLLSSWLLGCLTRVRAKVNWLVLGTCIWHLSQTSSKLPQPPLFCRDKRLVHGAD